MNAILSDKASRIAVSVNFCFLNFKNIGDIKRSSSVCYGVIDRGIGKVKRLLIITDL